MTDLWTSKLSEYLDGALTAADRRALEDHLADCQECPVVLDDLRRVVAQASALSDTPPSTDLWSGVASRLRDLPPDGIIDLQSERQRRGWGRRISVTIPQLMAAGIALAMLSGSLAYVLLSPARSNSVALDQALADLQQILEVGRHELDTTTVRILETNLALIDRALEQAQQAIAVDPANTYLRDHLEATKRQKLSLMRRAANLVDITS
jgi:hypothetical protein